MPFDWVLVIFWSLKKGHFFDHFWGLKSGHFWCFGGHFFQFVQKPGKWPFLTLFWTPDFSGFLGSFWLGDFGLTRPTHHFGRVVKYPLFCQKWVQNRWACFGLSVSTVSAFFFKKVTFSGPKKHEKTPFLTIFEKIWIQTLRRKVSICSPKSVSKKVRKQWYRDG